MPKWIRSRKLRWLGLLVIAYALVMTFGGCADKLLLFPSTEPVDAHGASRRTIPFNDGQLEIWTALSPGAERGTATSVAVSSAKNARAHTATEVAVPRGTEPEAYVLEFCGNATRAEDITTYVAGRWGERPIEVWVANYPGYGGSTGPATLTSIPPACLAAYDALASRAAGKPIFLAGNSLGSCAALYVAANRPCAGMIIQNPPPLKDLILGRFGWWNLWLAAGPIAAQIPDELNSITNAKAVKAPAVFLLAEKDELVLPEYQQKVADAYAGEKEIITVIGAGHNSPVEGTAESELDAAIDWLWEQSRGD